MYYRIPLCVINDPLNFDADHLAKKLVDKKTPKEVIYKVSTLENNSRWEWLSDLFCDLLIEFKNKSSG